MAVISTVQPGLKSDTATWAGGVVPAAPDQALIAHNVTVDEDWDIGSSPDVNSGEPSIEVTTGSLTFNENLTIRYRGQIRSPANKTVTVGAGCTFIADSSLATDPVNTIYRFSTAASGHGNPGVLVCNGTASNRITFTAVHYWRFRAAINGIDYSSGNMQAYFTDFSKTRGEGGFLCFPNSEDTIIHDCTFDDCTYLYGYRRVEGQLAFDMRRTTFTNTSLPAGQLVSLYILPGTVASDTILIDHCVFDDNIRVPADGITLTNCCLEQTLMDLPGASTQPVNISENVITGNSNSLNGNASRIYFLNSASNGHTIGASTGGGNLTLTNSVCEGDPAAAIDGEFAYKKDATTITLQNCITIPLPDKTDVYAVGMEIGQETSQFQTAKNCTFYKRGCQYGHDSIPTPANRQTFLDNIVWTAASDADGYCVRDLKNPSQSTDVGSPSTFNYNCSYNLPTPYVRVVFTSGTPGDNDISVDPQFVDPDANIVAWSQTLGGPSTFAGVIAEFRNMNNPSAIPGFTPTAALNYIFTAFTPQNPALQGAASDGGDIGAVPVAGAIVTQITAENIAGTDVETFTWIEVDPP